MSRDWFPSTSLPVGEAGSGLKLVIRDWGLVVNLVFYKFQDLFLVSERLYFD